MDKVVIFFHGFIVISHPLTQSSIGLTIWHQGHLCVRRWPQRNDNYKKNIRLCRDSFLQNLAGKNSAKYKSAFQLRCHLKSAAIVKVNNGPYHCSVELILRLWSKFQLISAPRSAVFTTICLCQISCSSCYIILQFSGYP